MSSATRKRPAKRPAKNLTTATAGDVEAFLGALAEPARGEARRLCAMFEAATGAPAKMWGKAIVGFGERKLVYASGREVDWLVIGFSPRKGRHVLYLGAGDGELDEELAALGPLERGKGCVYLRSLDDVPTKALARVLRKAAGRNDAPKRPAQSARPRSTSKRRARVVRAASIAVTAWLALLGLTACQSTVTPGATCARASDCSAGLACRYGRCRVECAVNRDCPAGAACLLLGDGVGACGVDQDLGCETGVGRMCPSGLVCAADRCQATCTTRSDCPADGDCVPLPLGGRFCIASGTDAGTPSEDTGVPTDASSVLVAPRSVCLGTESACLLGRDSRVYCWGHRDHGQLGRGEDCASASGMVPAAQLGPVLGPDGQPLSLVEQIACGDGFACAWSSDGSIACWGRNDLGQLGNGTADACSGIAQPLLIDDLSGGALQAAVVTPAPAISLAGAHGCYLDRSSSHVWCWGRDDALFGDAGTGTTTDVRTSAIRVSSILNLEGLGLGELGVATRGACALPGLPAPVWCWGDNEHGQSGRPLDAPVYTVPQDISDSITAMAVGRAHRCAWTPPTLSCFGDDARLQLGAAPAEAVPAVTDDCAAPETCSYVGVVTSGVPSLAEVVSHGDSDTTCAVVNAGGSNGQVFCWGDNRFSQSGAIAGESVPLTVAGALTPQWISDAVGPITSVEHVFVGPRAACAVTSDAVLYCWGDFELDGRTDHAVATSVDVSGWTF